jgi:hypothetical protein
MHTLIEYIGKRPTYKDSLFDTGDWSFGESKPVHDDVARKMLKHADQYRLAKPKTEGRLPKDAIEVGAGQTAQQDEAVGSLETADQQPEDTQDLRDAVGTMDKEALTVFAKTHFSTDLDKRIGVEKARSQVIGLIDQFGAE